jgi:hypothetical protein
VGAISLLAILVPLGFGLLLYHLGSASAPTSSSGSDGLINSSAKTTIQFPLLGTTSIPGVWTPDDTLKASVETSLNAGGGEASVLMASRSDQSVIWLANITKSGSGASGSCTTTPISNQSPILANHPAELDTFKLVCGGVTDYVLQYTMQVTNSTLLLRVVSPSSSVPFGRIENGMLQIPGSSTGGVSI